MTPTDSSLGQQIRRFEREHARNPEGLAFARLAEAYRRARQASRALDLLREGLRRHPTYPAGHLVRARALADLGRSDEAEASFHRVLELDPGNLVALRALARLARERGEPDQEREWIRKIRGAHPDGVEPSDAAGAGDRPAAEPEEAGGGTTAGTYSGASRSVRDILAPSAGDELDDPPRSAAHSREEREQLIEELSSVAHPSWWSEPGGGGAGRGGSGGSGDAADEGDSAGSRVVTETMARLYAQQGHWGEAEALYEELTRRRPDDGALRQRLEEVRSREVPTPERGVGREEAGDEGAGELVADGAEAGAAPGGREETGTESMQEHLRALLAGRARRPPSPGGPGAGPDGGRGARRRPVDSESHGDFAEEGGEK